MSKPVSRLSFIGCECKPNLYNSYYTPIKQNTFLLKSHLFVNALHSFFFLCQYTKIALQRYLFERINGKWKKNIKARVDT